MSSALDFLKIKGGEGGDSRLNRDFDSADSIHESIDKKMPKAKI